MFAFASQQSLKVLITKPKLTVQSTYILVLQEMSNSFNERTSKNARKKHRHNRSGTLKFSRREKIAIACVIYCTSLLVSLAILISLCFSSEFICSSIFLPSSSELMEQGISGSKRNNLSLVNSTTNPTPEYFPDRKRLCSSKANSLLIVKYFPFFARPEACS